MKVPITLRQALILAALFGAFLVWMLWQTEHDSCVRQDGSRTAIRTVAGAANRARLEDAARAAARGDLAAEAKYKRIAATYAQAERDARSLSCMKPFPDTN